MNLKCKKCGRWLGKIYNDVNYLVVKCGNCKYNNRYTVTFIGSFSGSPCYSRSRTLPSDSNGQMKTAERGGVREVNNNG